MAGTPFFTFASKGAFLYIIFCVKNKTFSVEAIFLPSIKKCSEDKFISYTYDFMFKGEVPVMQLSIYDRMDLLEIECDTVILKGQFGKMYIPSEKLRDMSKEEFVDRIELITRCKGTYNYDS